MRLVEIHSDRLLPSGEYLWYAGFWALEHVVGYPVVGLTPEEDKDVVFGARNPRPERLRILHGQSK